MRLTTPQIILLNHAASINYKRMEARRKHEGDKKQETDDNDPVVMNGKRLSELNTDEMMAYLNNGAD